MLSIKAAQEGEDPKAEVQYTSTLHSHHVSYNDFVDGVWFGLGIFLKYGMNFSDSQIAVTFFLSFFPI